MGDISDVIKQFSSIVDSKNIPDNLKDILGSLNNSNNNDTSNNISPDAINNLLNSFKNSNTSSNSSDSSNTSSIDFDTILKIKSIMEKLNTKDDPRAKLLLSLKPYLKNSRKNKVEQYIQLFNMTKLIDVLDIRR